MEGYSVKAILSVTDKGFTSGMNKALSTIENLSNRTGSATGSMNKLTSSFKSTAAAIGVMKVASKAMSVLTGSIDDAISRYDTLNRFPKVLQQIGFSADDSKKSINKLSKGIQGLPTTLDDVAATTQRIAVLTGDLDKATKTTLALNDAFLSNGSSTEDASRGLIQYIQMLSKGTVDMQSWRTLQETMGNALNDVAKAFGYAGSSAQNDLYKALQNGEITFDEFNDKLIELDGGLNGFASRAKTASAGIATSMKNVKIAVVRGMTGIIESTDKVLSSNDLPTIQQSIEKIGVAAESAIGSVGNFIGLFEKTEDPAKNLQNMQKAFEQLAPIMGLVGSGGALVGILPVIDSVGSGFEEISEKGKLLSDSVSKAKENATLFGKTIKGSIEPGSESFKKLNVQSKLFVERIAGTKQILKGTFDPDSTGFSKYNKSSKEFLINLDNMASKAKSAGSIIGGLGKKVGSLIPEKAKKGATDFGDILSGTFIQSKGRIEEVGNKIADLSFKFSSTTGRFEKDAPLAWRAFDGIGKKIESISPKLKNFGSLFGNGLKESANVGLSAFSKMVSGLGVIFNAALAVVGPAAVLGLLVVGLGLVNKEFGTEINNIIKTVQSKGPMIITTFANGIVSKIPELAKTGSILLNQILTTIAGLLPSITTAGINILNALIAGVTSNMDVILQGVMSLIGSIATSIIQLAPNIMMAGLTILESLVLGILNNMPTILAGIQGLFSQISTAIQTYLPLMLTKGIEILQNIATGIAQALPEIVISAIDTVTKFVSTLSQNVDKILKSGVEIVKTLVGGISDRLPDILEAGVNLIVTIVEGIVNNLPEIVNSGMEIIGKLIVGIGKSIPDILKAAGDLVLKLGDKFLETDWGSIGSDIISGIAKGISGAAGALWRAAKSALGSFKDKVLGFFGISGSGSGKSGGSARAATSRAATARTFAMPYSANANYQPALASVPSYQSVNSGFPQIASLSTIADNMKNRTFSFDMSTDLNYIALSVIDERDKKIGVDRANENKIYLIENTIEIDGRQIAKATAEYTEKELKTLEKRRNRMNGIM